MDTLAVITHADDSRDSKAFIRVCLCVVLYVDVSVCSIPKKPKVFERCIGNDLGLFYKCYDFGVERSKVKVTASQNAKNIEDDRVASVSYAFYRVFSL